MLDNPKTIEKARTLSQPLLALALCIYYKAACVLSFLVFIGCFFFFSTAAVNVARIPFGEFILWVSSTLLNGRLRVLQLFWSIADEETAVNSFFQVRGWSVQRTCILVARAVTIRNWAQALCDSSSGPMNPTFKPTLQPAEVEKLIRLLGNQWLREKDLSWVMTGKPAPAPISGRMIWFQSGTSKWVRSNHKKWRDRLRLFRWWRWRSFHSIPRRKLKSYRSYCWRSVNGKPGRPRQDA